MHPVLIGVVDLLGGIFILVAGLEWMREKNKRRLGNPYARWLGIFLMVSIVSSFFRGGLRAHWIEVTKDLYVILIFFSSLHVLSQKGLPQKTVTTFLVVGGIVTGIGLGAYLLHMLGVDNPFVFVTLMPFFGERVRLLSTFCSPQFAPTMLATYLVLVLSLIWQKVSIGNHRFQWSVLFGFAFLALWLTYSRVFAGVAATVLFLLLWRRNKTLVLAGLVGLVLLLELSSSIVVRDVVWRWSREDLGPSKMQYSFYQSGVGSPKLTFSITFDPASYGLLKRIAWDGFRKHPWLGVGPGGFQILTQNAVSEKKIHDRYRYAMPHSTWLGLLATRGLLGCGAFAMFCMHLAKTARRRFPNAFKHNEATYSPVMAYTLLGLVLTGFYVDLHHLRHLWLYLALFASQQGVIPS